MRLAYIIALFLQLLFIMKRESESYTENVLVSVCNSREKKKKMLDKQRKLLAKASPCVLAVLFYAFAAPAAAIQHCVWTPRASHSLQV